MLGFSWPGDSAFSHLAFSFCHKASVDVYSQLASQERECGGTSTHWLIALKGKWFSLFLLICFWSKLLTWTLSTVMQSGNVPWKDRIWWETSRFFLPPIYQFAPVFQQLSNKLPHLLKGDNQKPHLVTALNSNSRISGGKQLSASGPNFHQGIKNVKLEN